MKKSTTVATMANGLLKVLQRYIKGIRLVAVLTMLFTVGVGSMWGATDVSEFTSNAFAGLSNKWTKTSSGTLGYEAARGVQHQKSATTTFTATGFSNVTKVQVWVARSSNGKGSVTIQENNTSKKTISSFNTSSTEQSYSWATPYTGTLKIVVTATGSSIYIKKIVVTTEDAVSCTVTYDSNGGSGTMSSSIGSSVIIAECSFIAPSGKVFSEWNDKSNGTGTSYAPGDVVAKDLKLYAIWEAIPTHKVYFNTGGLVDIESVDVQEGQTYNITQTPASSLTQECEYNTFVGWTKSNKIANPSSKPTIVNSIEMESSDITLYAVYSKTEGGGGSAAEQGTTMFSENWKGCTNNTQPTQPTTSGSAVYNAADIDYVWYTPSGGSKTQTYTSGGPNSNENILISKNNGYWKVVGIPTGQAETLTLSFSKSGSGVLSVSTSTSNVSISGSTITIGSSSVNTFDLIFTNTKSGDNLRLDDISVVVAKAGATGSTTYSLTPECTAKPSRLVVDFVV